MKLYTIAVALTLTGAATTAAHAVDWYRWRGPDLNGISKETGWQTSWPESGPKQLWKAPVGTGFSSFSISRDRVYTMGNTNDTDVVSCLEAGSGKFVWQHAYACPLDPKNFEGGPGATPTVDGDFIYTFSRKGHVYCLNAADGKVAWSKNLNKELGLEIPTWGFAGSALVEGNLVILNAGNAGIALDKKSGKVVWDSGKGPGGYATAVPLAGPDGGVAMFSRQSLIAVKAADGRELWSYPWKTSYDVNAADPVIAGDRVFMSSGYNHGATVIRIKGSQAEKVWESKNMRNHFNSCVLWQEHLYGVDENQLRCLELGTGAVKWTEKSVGKGSLMLANGRLIVLSEKGELMVAPVTPEAFTTTARAKVLSGRCWTVPVLANGHIYCRNAAGDVVCVDVRGK